MTYAANGFEPLAETCYRQAIALDPNEARLHYLLALVLAEQNRVLDAIDACVRVQAMAPTYAPAWRQCGSWRLDSGRAEQALSDFQRAQALAPNEIAGSIGVAQALLELGRAQEAADQLTAIRRTHPDAAEYVERLLATALQRLGRVAEAERLADRPYVAVPRGPDPWIQGLVPLARGLSNARKMANILLADHRNADAVRVLESARPYPPDDVRTPRLLARAYSGAGREREAAAVLRDAVRISPENAALHVDLAEHCARSGDLASARTAIEIALRLEPDDARAAAIESDLLMREGRYPEARLAFRRAATKDPRNVDLRVGLALACAETQQYAEACSAALAALERDPDRAAAWACLALGQFELGQTTEAEHALQRAHALAPGDALVKSVALRLRAGRR